MQNLQRELTVSWTIMTVAVFCAVSGVFACGIFVLMVIFGFDWDIFGAIANGFWVLPAIAAAHFLVANSLFRGGKTGWYAGLSLLGAVIWVLANMRSVGYVNFDDVCRFLVLVNIPFLIVLIVGRKSYFAVINEMKKKAK